MACIGDSGYRLDVRIARGAVRARLLVDHPVEQAEILLLVREEQGQSSLAIATRTTEALEILLDRERMLPVHDQTDVGNVDAHAERAGRDNRIDGWQKLSCEATLDVVSPVRVVGLRVKELEVDSSLRQSSLDQFPFLDPRDKDDGSARPDLTQQTRHHVEAPRILLRHGKANQRDVRTIWVLGDHPGLRTAEGFADVALHLLARSGGEHQDLRPAEKLPDRTELRVHRAKALPVLGNGVRFIDDEVVRSEAAQTVILGGVLDDSGIEPLGRHVDEFPGTLL